MGKRSRTIHERKIRSEEICPGVLALSNEKVIPEKLQQSDTMIFDLSEVYNRFIYSALPRFASEEESFAFTFLKEANSFGSFKKSSFESFLRELYSTYDLKEGNIFEYKAKENTYWLGVLQPTKPYDIQRAELCMTSMVCGIEVNGQGFLFKRKEDVYQVKDFLDALAA